MICLASLNHENNFYYERIKNLSRKAIRLNIKCGFVLIIRETGQIRNYFLFNEKIRAVHTDKSLNYMHIFALKYIFRKTRLTLFHIMGT